MDALRIELTDRRVFVMGKFTTVFVRRAVIKRTEYRLISADL